MLKVLRRNRWVNRLHGTPQDSRICSRIKLSERGGTLPGISGTQPRVPAADQGIENPARLTGNSRCRIDDTDRRTGGTGYFLL